jgi:uncharacterized protein DUF6159
VAFAYVALSRLAGGKATLMEGLAVARSRVIPIVQWGVLSATVRLALRVMDDKGAVGKWISSFLGYAWNLATYFIIPILALGEVTVGSALYRSADLVRQKWGEIITAQFSFALLFYLCASPALVFFAFAGISGHLLTLASIMAAVYLWVVALIIFSAEHVFVSALYLFARDGKIANGFAKSDFINAWGLPALADVEV